MGWEERNGRLYYYQTKRNGKRVVKEYVPLIVAEAAAILDEDARVSRKQHVEKLRQAKADLDALGELVAPLDDLADTLTRGAMLAAGYRQHHRGEWRRTRGHN